jgi:putative CRISPR-associated protein (TIGR02619 family)
MPNTLICTVGTSLLTNSRRSPDSKLSKAIAFGNVQGTVVELLKMTDVSSACAEINSVDSMFKHKYLGLTKRCLFLVSDTREGEFVGAVLSQYIQSSKCQCAFIESEYQVITGLSDTDIKLFRNTGLRNLVRLIGKETRKTGASNIIINATGGYKAQISFAGMIGQALGIPVAYMHEKFSECIMLPPQPVNLDMEFWLENSEDFFALNDGTPIPDSEYIKRNSKFESLIETIHDGPLPLTSLSPTGQLFHESFSERFTKKQQTLLPAAADIAPEKKKRTYEDKNHGKHPGLVAWLDKLCTLPFVKSIATEYYNPDLNEPLSFRITSNCRADQIYGIFSNAGATTKFFMTTTATTDIERRSCLVYCLNALQNGEL